MSAWLPHARLLLPARGLQATCVVPACAGAAHQSTLDPVGMALIVILRNASFTVVPFESVVVSAGSGT